LNLSAVYVTWLKRLFDIVVSAVAIVVLLPLIALVALAVRVALGPPVFFFDQRAGLGGTPIQIIKFRSMTSGSDEAGRPLPDDQRLGRFGRILRRTSLDELPQLLSVLAGDMSLVGPRPLPTRYVARYNARQAIRMQVRPGLTGWAQIHGRNSVDWPERLEYDAQYVDRLVQGSGLVLDTWILAVTAVQVVGQALTGRGVAADGAATMHEFKP
jgi:sugar transferase EpsL